MDLDSLEEFELLELLNKLVLRLCEIRHSRANEQEHSALLDMVAEVDQDDEWQQDQSIEFAVGEPLPHVPFKQSREQWVKLLQKSWLLRDRLLKN